MGSETVSSPVEDALLADTPEPRQLPPARPAGGPSFPNPDTLQSQGPLVDLTPPPGYASGQGMSGPSGAPQVSPQGPLAALGAFLAKPPANTRPAFGESQGMVPSPPLGMAMPPAASLLGRSALQGGAAGLEALEAGKGPLDIAKEAGKGAAFNVGAEKVLGPLARFVGRQAAPANAAAKLAHDEAMTGALNTAEKGAHTTALATHAEQGAAKIATDLEAQVPALAGMKRDGKGLYDAIYGSGRAKVSDAFDTALKDVVSKGKGQIVQVPEEVAVKYGLNNAGGSGVAGLPANVQALFNKGAQKAGIQVAGTPGMVGVDAAELAQKMTGSWKKDPGAYRAAAGALDAANIGDPAARAAYKTYTGVSEFLDKAKALDANGTFNPANVMKAMADLKKVEILRRRGLGSGTEGPIQEAARGGPLAPTPREVPAQANDISGIQNPFAGHPWIAGMAGGSMGAGLGHALGAGPLGHALGFAAGAGAANAMPSQIVTKGPLSAGAEKAAQNLPDLAGILARLGYNKVTST